VSQLPGRKRSHLELCVRGDVEQRGGSLLDQVHLLHEALPEVSWADVDLSVELFGRRLLAPLVISGMSGGTAEAGELNRALATAAQKLGLGLGVGSQRIMLQHPETTDTFQVRDVAPDILLLANLGAHLNPAQELVQDEGDRDFRGCLGAIRAIAAELPVPVIAKETGCGLGPAALERLRAAGIDWVDVAGAGGTTWPGVEGLRGSERQRALGAELRAWGIPTAAAVVYARRAGLRTIASGGIRSGLDAARALALGADATGVALPFLRAFASGGLPGVLRTAEALVEALRAVTLLTGAYNVGSLRAAPTVIGHELRSWLD
jgi:isopentenyl-diphosphate delta-isomerase